MARTAVWADRNHSSAVADYFALFFGTLFRLGPLVFLAHSFLIRP